ncbi:MAG TPA: hypothetical protein VK149_03890 [Sideroxyarcus sp.]|nr:hypothetical protein [Sideroxyarcus sp.]
MKPQNIALLDQLIILVVVLLSGSLYYASFGKNILLLPFAMGLAAIFLLRKCTISRPALFYAMALLLVVLANPTSKHSTTAVLMLNLIIAFFVTSLIPIQRFAKVYLQCLVVLSVCSWLAIPIWILGMPSPLPDFLSIIDGHYQNYIVVGILNPMLNIDGMGLFRNAGLFWEPGAFQYFVNTAFLLGIIFSLITPRIYFIFLITILTANSTAGLIIFSILSLLHVYSAKLTWKQGLKGVVGIVLAFMVVHILMKQEFVQSEGEPLKFRSALSISKPQEKNTVKTSHVFFEGNVQKFQRGSTSYGSYDARFNDFIIDWELLKEHPLQGIGLGNFAAREEYGVKVLGESGYWSNMPPGADGFFLMVVQLGLLGSLLLYPIVMPRYLNKYSLIIRLAAAGVTVLLLCGENMFLYGLPWILAMYGVVGMVSDGKVLAAEKNIQSPATSNQ